MCNKSLDISDIDIKFKCIVCESIYPAKDYDEIVENGKTCLICRTLGDKAYNAAGEREKKAKYKTYHDRKQAEVDKMFEVTRPNNLRREKPTKGKHKKRKIPIFKCTNEDCGIETEISTRNKTCNRCGQGRLVFIGTNKSK